MARIKGEIGRRHFDWTCCCKKYLAEKSLSKYAVILMVSGQVLGDIYQNYRLILRINKHNAKNKRLKNVYITFYISDFSFYSETHLFLLHGHQYEYASFFITE